MDTGQRRSLVAIGAAVLAVALLLGAFVFVWLLPRGPQTGDAQVNQSTGTGATGSKLEAAPASNPSLSQAGAPGMAPITDQPHITRHCARDGHRVTNDDYARWLPAFAQVHRL